MIDLIDLYHINVMSWMMYLLLSSNVGKKKKDDIDIDPLPNRFIFFGII